MKTMGRKPLPRKTKLGKALTKLREDLGLTQEQAAEKIHVHERTWLNWENGATIPLSMQELIRLKLGKF